MPVFDFFSDQGLVRPEITAEDAESMAESLFGITGTARELGSQQDRNFRIDSPLGDGVRRYVLKVDNPAFSAAELAAQGAVRAHSRHLAVNSELSAGPNAPPKPQPNTSAKPRGFHRQIGTAGDVSFRSRARSTVTAVRVQDGAVDVALVDRVAGRRDRQGRLHPRVDRVAHDLVRPHVLDRAEVDLALIGLY